MEMWWGSQRKVLFWLVFKPTFGLGQKRFVHLIPMGTHIISNIFSIEQASIGGKPSAYSGLLLMLKSRAASPNRKPPFTCKMVLVGSLTKMGMYWG